MVFSIFKPNIKLPKRWINKGFDSISLKLKLASLNEETIIRGNISCRCYIELDGSVPNYEVKFYRDLFKKDLMFHSSCKKLFLSDIEGVCSI